MSLESGAALQKSLDAIDSLRKRVYVGGWVVVAATLTVYARLAYIERTSDNLERLLSTSVMALTLLIAWAAFAIILTVTRTTRSILRAIALSSRNG